jgi:hypothetical protein
MPAGSGESAAVHRGITAPEATKAAKASTVKPTTQATTMEAATAVETSTTAVAVAEGHSAGCHPGGKSNRRGDRKKLSLHLKPPLLCGGTTVAEGSWLRRSAPTAAKILIMFWKADVNG